MLFERPVTPNLPYGLMSVVAGVGFYALYIHHFVLSSVFLQRRPSASVFVSVFYLCSLMSVVFYALLVASYAWEVQALLDLPIDVLILVW